MFLEKIYEKRKEAIELCKQQEPLEILMSKLPHLDFKPYSFKEALKSEAVGLIAEIKKASPSRGILNKELNPVETAKAYEASGAVAISVLTEPEYFLGKYQYLYDIKQAVQVPVLDKDFIFDSWQIYKAKTIGADAILLIATMLSLAELKELYDCARHLKLDVLMEVHNEEDLEKALAVGADIIGINNRDLYTFQIALETTTKLGKLVPEGILVVSESGIHTVEDMKKIKAANVNAILVGESLVTASNLEEQVQLLRG